MLIGTSGSSDGYTLTVQDAAALLGLSVQTVYGYVSAGTLPCLRTVGRMCIRVRNGRREQYRKTGRVRFSRAELEAWIAAHHTRPAVTAPAPNTAAPDPDDRLPASSGDYIW